MFEALLPPAIEPVWAALLIAVSAVTSFVTASLGLGGGVILLAVMALIVPGPAIIPVHGAVQIGSNA
ncbi:MAG: sulfite exporter TauE/SafE family protein, partial [Pseudomonadota bacterium]